MKILFICPYVPNKIRVRPFQFIRHLTEANHEVYLNTLFTSEQEFEDVEVLRSYCAEVTAIRMDQWQSMFNCVKGVFLQDPLQSVYSWQPKLANALKTQLEEQAFDVIHVEHLRGARYGLWINRYLSQTRSRNNSNVVWDSVDSISLLFEQASTQSSSLKSRVIANYELPRTKRFEGYLVNQFEKILTTSLNDLNALAHEAGDNNHREKIRIIPNGVDLDYFFPKPDHPRDPFGVVISGKMSYHANVTMVERFVNNIFPQVLENIPEANLTIVGKDPPKHILDLGKNPAITVTGTVPDIRPYFWGASVAVAPLLYGVGIQNKVLEAMACALPVVTSPQGVSALSVQNNKEIMVAKNDDEFAQAVINLLKNPDQRHEIGQSGRAYVELNHRWGNIVAKLLEVYYEGPSCLSRTV